MATHDETDLGMGGRLKALRKQRYDDDSKWTLEWVAAKVGTTKANLSKIENKPKTRVDLGVFFELARLYEVDPQALATGKPTKASAVPPNMLALIDDYSAIDEDVRAPLRTLLRTLAEHGKTKPTLRKKIKNKPRVSTLDIEA